MNRPVVRGSVPVWIITESGRNLDFTIELIYRSDCPLFPVPSLRTNGSGTTGMSQQFRGQS